MLYRICSLFLSLQLFFKALSGGVYAAFYCSQREGEFLGYFVVFITGDVQTVTLHHASRCQAKMEIKKRVKRMLDSYFCSVGVTGFEPATTRPPDVYSNRAELHPV